MIKSRRVYFLFTFLLAAIFLSACGGHKFKSSPALVPPQIPTPNAFAPHATTSGFQATGLQATVCNKYAAPGGSDSNSGTLASPYATVARLDSSLSAGQTGCLRAGNYISNGTYTHLSNSAGVTLTAAPGEQATLQGGFYVDGAGTHISYLNVDQNGPLNPWPALCQGAISGGAKVTASIELAGSNIVYEHNNNYVDSSVPLTSRGGIIGTGWNTTTSNVIIRYNRIHDFGFCPVEQHAVYVDSTQNAQVYGNWLYNLPAGTGVQVWDHAHNAHIYSNVVSGASSCFDVGSNTSDTTGTLLEHNICNNTVGVQSPYSNYCNSPGPGCTGPDPGNWLFDYWGSTNGTNKAQNNLVYCASGTNCSTTNSDQSGITVSGTIIANPQFSDPSYTTNHDFRIASTSPAASWGIWDGDLNGQPQPPQPTGAPSVPTGLAATGSDVKVTLNWKANASSENILHYNVYRTDQTFTGAWASPTGTSFVNASSVVNGTKYCYQITAVNSSGESTKTAQVCATPTSTAPAPATVPTGLTVTASGGGIKLSWNPNPAAEQIQKYNVSRTSSSVATTTSDTITAGTQYCYQISAVNTLGKSGESPVVCATSQ